MNPDSYRKKVVGIGLLAKSH